MDVELVEIRDFLAAHHPFDLLPPEELERLPKRPSVRHFRRGTSFPPADDDQPYLYIVRRGALDLRDGRGDLIGKLAEGDLCPWPCRPEDYPETLVSCNTAEDTLVYLISCAEMERLRGRDQAFCDHFERTVAERLRNALDLIKERPATSTGLMKVRISDLLDRPMVSCMPDTSIREAARAMAERRISSLIVMDGQRLVGMITDRDLRSRCIAAGLHYDDPVRRIMTENLRTAEAETLGFQALIAMTRLNVHHLPVLDGRRVVGVVTTSDLLRFQSANYDHTSDIKHRGIVPVVDLARIYALSAGIPQINTIERLERAAEVKALSRDGASNLIDALVLIGTLRMQHQARQIRRGEKADNYVSPDQLSSLERGHLEDAFSVIHTMQEVLGQRYQTGRFT